MVVTREQINSFQEDGAILLKNVFSPEWVEKVKQGIEKNLANPSQHSERLALKEGQGHYFNDYCNWRSIDEFSDFAYNSPASEIAGRMMKSKYCVFYHEHVLNKEPGTEKETPWHHDQAYYPIDGENVVSIWMPVDPVSIESSVKFVKGSHRWGKWFNPRKFASETNYPIDDEGFEEKIFYDVPVEDIESGKYELLSWSCDPGDCVVFHGKTLHGARGNNSSSLQRRVLSTRWIGEGARLARRPWQVSPPELGGLKYGDIMVSDVFPCVWGTIA